MLRFVSLRIAGTCDIGEKSELILPLKEQYVYRTNSLEGPIFFQKSKERITLRYDDEQKRNFGYPLIRRRYFQEGPVKFKDI